MCRLTDLQVKTGSIGFIHDDVSMFERGKLENKINYNVSKTNY